MKRAFLLLSVLFLTVGAFATDFADHPLVGRYPDSSIQHQEISNFGQYTILVGEEETETIQGEVWMTLYTAPGDSSTFSVYSTYLDFLEAEGFTILVSCEPGHCGGSTLADAYNRAPFADHGNYNYSAPITNGTWSAACYISAKRESGGSTIYVSIAIAAGWYDFPQYKLDVVKVASNTASIVSVGTREEEEPVAEASAAAEPSGTAGVAPSTTGAESDGALFSGTGSVRAQAGAGIFAFADPDFAGGLTEYTDLAGTVGTMGGFRNLYGPFAEMSWFLNQNLGILADVTHFTIENTTGIGDTTFSYSVNMTFIQAGAMARVVGDAYPVTLGLGFSAGFVLIEFYQRSVSDVPGESRYYVAEDFFPAFRYSAELTIPIVSVGRLSAGFQYVFVPVGNLTFEQDGGSDYYIEYKEPNLGGLILRVGLVAEL